MNFWPPFPVGATKKFGIKCAFLLTQTVFIYQVLLHEPDEVPLMQGKAFAISPGLYSMVAIEKSEVGFLH